VVTRLKTSAINALKKEECIPLQFKHCRLAYAGLSESSNPEN